MESQHLLVVIDATQTPDQLARLVQKIKLQNPQRLSIAMVLQTPHGSMSSGAGLAQFLNLQQQHLQRLLAELKTKLPLISLQAWTYHHLNSAEITALANYLDAKLLLGQTTRKPKHSPFRWLNPLKRQAC